MTATNEAITATLAQKIEELTAQVITLVATAESTNSSVQEARTDIREIARVQTDHGTRITQNEMYVNRLREQGSEVAELRAEISSLKTEIAVAKRQLENVTPQKTPWTSVAAVVVSITALGWTLLGK